MKETNDSKPYEKLTTPAPKTVPTLPTPNKPSDEAEAELEALSTANKALFSQAQAHSLQAQALSAQVVSLTALLAERGMAEISRHKWADLSRVATTDYVPGQYRIETPQSDDQELRVTLSWEPGQVLLCEGFHRTLENTLILILPSVRIPRFHPVPTPLPGTIPPRPPAANQPVKWTTMDPAEQMAIQQHNEQWQAHLQPIMTAVTQEQMQTQDQALKDEEELAYLAIQAIQTRRKNPKTPPGQTIAAALVVVAKEMQGRAARGAS